jgi:pyruvate-ferredoxin/flavodoxin oxidoreductase
MVEALAWEGPALLQVYAPSPARHGFETRQTLDLARLALDTRTLPVFRYDPHGEGVFGTRISLGGNPAPDETLVPPGEDGRIFTTAEWALGQGRFGRQFAPLAADAPSPMPFHEQRPEEQDAVCHQR